MENRKLKKISIAALIVSIFPLATFIPILFNISLSDSVRSIWAIANIFSVFAGLILSFICIKNRDNRNVINIISTIISCFWVLLIAAVIALALFISFA